MKTLLKILVAITFYFFLCLPVSAQNVADQSAKFLRIEVNNLDAIRLAKKRLALNKLLTRYNSPLVNSIDTFLKTCDSFELDCYLLPSIAGLESGFGKFTHPGSNNPFGWGGGYILFTNWDQAIFTVGKGLRQNYLNKGAESVDEIAPIYAESKTWAPRVKNFITQFEAEEAKITAILNLNPVEL
ncbi:hypothetical protein A2954_00340 [Candidatus Roizmanbacteria bacterium RIFCSPLOWO2_01_FULL_37_12]|uniref:Mannosyl-glycoprotein endo-beta-N-acetylglucosamidase-like domain-containing protein n=1 Tax=Candidatus Roizmanbacteria bacterium RIFCSPLOWO2_01_FULL_37_12 TaxID=1802056 RepID=A0A1F7IB87_9BACT|nr:MAG: hypothetical protein A2768_00445 [Candidatus Roizmanbacteria bacterium RIFCSPHIGHO2_01_FULL_37_16]OGK25924.1 MAG: hypothetical protein A3D76_06830 [Candidatus Roizmanbacteria bacterium RIFCSPHIGHO2_02_FULL_37_9b]OGK40610.1 MAG: hypothetical protein A2954_00340 [Candidatus Roizmanbacteria bacterium RIFCSPLOWO2_01_FULL_37_12]